MALHAAEAAAVGGRRRRRPQREAPREGRPRGPSSRRRRTSPRTSACASPRAPPRTSTAPLHVYCARLRRRGVAVSLKRQIAVQVRLEPQPTSHRATAASSRRDTPRARLRRRSPWSCARGPPVGRPRGRREPLLPGAHPRRRVARVASYAPRDLVKDRGGAVRRAPLVRPTACAEPRAGWRARARKWLDRRAGRSRGRRAVRGDAAAGGEADERVERYRDALCDSPGGASGRAGERFLETTQAPRSGFSTGVRHPGKLARKRAGRAAAERDLLGAAGTRPRWRSGSTLSRRSPRRRRSGERSVSPGIVSPRSSSRCSTSSSSRARPRRRRRSTTATRRRRPRGLRRRPRAHRARDPHRQLKANTARAVAAAHRRLVGGGVRRRGPGHHTASTSPRGRKKLVAKQPGKSPSKRRPRRRPPPRRPAAAVAWTGLGRGGGEAEAAAPPPPPPKRRRRWRRTSPRCGSGRRRRRFRSVRRKTPGRGRRPPTRSSSEAGRVRARGARRRRRRATIGICPRPRRRTRSGEMRRASPPLAVERAGGHCRGLGGILKGGVARLRRGVTFRRRRRVRRHHITPS